MHYVPDSLYMFLNLILDEQEILENQATDETKCQTQLNITQDLVYVVSKHLTPRHIGLCSSFHQATHSKQIVQLFHTQGLIGYTDILKLDTVLAEKTLESMVDITMLWCNPI